ncbi:MAG: helix-turn-helix domain-containing protein [archaeon]
MDTEQLRKLGLSESEAKVYLTLLRWGESTVAEISQNAGLHRTNIYDSSEKLKEKGLVSYLLKNNKQYVRAADPEALLHFLKEQEESIEKLVPKLKAIQSRIPEKVTVEIFKGQQGMKAALKDILLKKQTVLGYSISGQLRTYLPEFAKYYFREQTKNKILHKFIYTEGVKPPAKHYDVKYLPKEYLGSSGNLCYGDVLLNLIWEPELVAIRIQSKELAENFRKHFKLLWSIATSRPEI